MTYLLSLLATEFSSKEYNYILCYYVNDTSHNQMIRVMSGIKCHFERIVFSGERLLFEALPNSCLEVYLSEIDGTLFGKIDCKSLQINDQPNLIKSLN
jgi:hypothetical protein